MARKCILICSKLYIINYLLISVLVTGIFSIVNIVNAQELSKNNFTIRGTVDFGMFLSRQSGINTNCKTNDPDDTACSATNYIGKSLIRPNLNRSNIIIQANKINEIGSIGLYAQLFFANPEEIKNSLRFYLYSQKLGVYSFGIQDIRSYTLQVDHIFNQDDNLSFANLLYQSTSKARLFGQSFAAKKLELGVYKKGLARFRFTSLGLKGFRWQASVALDSPDSSNKISNMNFHLGTVFKYEFFNYNLDKNHFNYGVETSIALATKIYRIPRSNNIDNKYPLSTNLGLRIYLNSFRIGIAGSLDLFAIDRNNGFGPCNTNKFSNNGKCLNRWSIATGVAYFAPENEFSVHIRGFYSQVDSTPNRDIMVYNQDPNNTTKKLQTFGTDMYYRLQLGGSYNISNRISAYMEIYIDKDTVASSKFHNPASSNYVNSKVADSSGVGMQIGTQIKF